MLRIFENSFDEGKDLVECLITVALGHRAVTEESGSNWNAVLEIWIFL